MPEDLQTVILENDTLTLSIIPACGGKVISLKSTGSGREWLWRNPALDPVAPVYGNSFIKTMDSGGWDEMFPSILPCEVSLPGGQSMLIPDHGDLSAQACQTEQPSPDAIRTITRGRCAPYLFIRTLTLKANRLRADYEITNTGAADLPWIWFAHPLLKLEPGMQLITDQRIPFEVTYTETPSPYAVGELLPWPGKMIIPDVDAPGFEGYAFKLASASQQCSHFACRAADGSETLRFEWDASPLSYLALWLNCGGWHGAGDKPYFNLGLEPATAPDDSLCDAIENNRAQWLAPADTARWSVDITLEKGNNHDD